jgi:hypothetical protein
MNEASNKNEILFRKDYFAALESADEISKLTSQVNKLTAKVAGLSHYGKLQGAALQFKSGLEAIKQSGQMLNEIALADREQASLRGMKELSLLCHNRLMEIPHQIKLAKRAYSDDVVRYKSAANELVKKGFIENQIALILVDTPKPPDEQAHYMTIIKPLEEEQAKIEAFVADFPRYDQSLLADTQFEGWQPEKVADFDAAATALGQ